MTKVYKKINRSKSIKEYILYLFLCCIDFLNIPKQKPKTNEKWLLIVKLDLLGDYVLLRNFFGEIKSSPQYAEHNIAFCCNAGIQELSQFLDKNIIAEWIPIKLKPFISKWTYRKKILEKITRKKYDLAIFPTQSRSFFYDDYIAKIITAVQKIAPVGNSYNHAKWQSVKSIKYYTRLLKQDMEFGFEFDLNRKFFEELLNKSIDLAWPKISISQNAHKHKILVSPGASAAFRRWSTENFIVLIDAILSIEKNAVITISGSSAEKHLGDAIKASFNENPQVKNSCGHLSLSELSLELASCQIVISNESGLVHLAKAIGVPYIYCISNGNHFQRFNPYPEKDPKSKLRYFYPAQFEAILQLNDKLTIQKYYWGSRIPIESVKPDIIISFLRKDFL